MDVQLCSTSIYGQCGSDAAGSKCCPSGSYCAHISPLYYQCLPSPSPSTPEPSCPTSIYGQCGSDAAGPKCCPTGSYCAHISSLYYQCLPNASPTCGAEEVNVDYYGDDITSVRGGLSSDCCSACLSTPGCQAYTFVSSSSVCYLKTGKGAPKSAAELVSATVNKPGKCSYTGGVDFYGNDLVSVNGLSSASDCCDKCAVTSRCAAFTFVKSVCYLKTKAGDASSLVGGTSGVLN